MKLEKLDGTFAVCKLESVDDIDVGGEFASLTVTDSEVSLVCEQSRVPIGCIADRGWKALRISGTLDFALVGILAEISGILARAAVSIYAVSTYDTDYLFVKANQLDTARTTLEAAGHEFIA